MTVAASTRTPITTHLACMAAGVRDGLRTAQYYARDLSNADGANSTVPRNGTFLSQAVAGVAKGMDSSLSKAGDISIHLIRPQWRNLPSPFEQSVRRDVIQSIQQNQLAFTSQFTAYFFRSSTQILRRWAYGHHLVLEHRIEAARRALQRRSAPADAAIESKIAQVLLQLIMAAPIARFGAPTAHGAILNVTDPNITIMATACLALLLAEDGKPIDALDEVDFLEVTGALLGPRLLDLAEAVHAQDQNAIADVLIAVRELY
jgi:hypothetical protein